MRLETTEDWIVQIQKSLTGDMPPNERRNLYGGIRLMTSVVRLELAEAKRTGNTAPHKRISTPDRK